VSVSSETEDFLAEMLPKQRAAEKALHDGDVEPRLALWTRATPVTLLGAKLTATGWDEIEPSFREVASWFSGSEFYEFDVVAAGASTDLAYTVGYERNVAITNGERREYVLRATHVYRRENGQWRIVHRHADPVPDTNDEGAPRLGTVR
jgi:ketosteroid isomerase-like protein